MYFLLCEKLESDIKNCRRMFTLLDDFLASSTCTCKYSFFSLFLVVLDLHMKNYLNVLILWVTEMVILLLDTLLLDVDGEKTV